MSQGEEWSHGYFFRLLFRLESEEIIKAGMSMRAFIDLADIVGYKIKDGDVMALAELSALIYLDMNDPDRPKTTHALAWAIVRKYASKPIDDFWSGIIDTNYTPN